jgi:hypothetical protein
MDNWHLFWDNYRNDIYPKNKKDLLVQVGKTINKLPVSETDLDLIAQDICEKLKLTKTDLLLEMCCGNGIITEKISKKVQKMLAFDFTPHLINSAIKFNTEKNIDYQIGNANEDFFELFNPNAKIEKFLMSFSLGYFTANELEQILIRLKTQTDKILFYITEVPIDEFKWNFYNTKKRKENYLKNMKKNDFNDGMGRWWKKNELIDIGKRLGLRVEFYETSSRQFNYRLNVLYKSMSES